MRISQISWKKLDIQPQQTWVHYDNIEYPRYSPSHRPQFCNLGKNNKYINLLVLLVGILIRTACHTLAHAFDCPTGHICVRCRWPRGSHVMDRCTWISTTSTHLTAPVIDYSFWSVKNFDSISNLVLLLHAGKWYSAMHVTILDWRRLNTFGNMLIDYTKQMIPPGAHTRSGNQTLNF